MFNTPYGYSSTEGKNLQERSIHDNGSSGLNNNSEPEYLPSFLLSPQTPFTKGGENESAFSSTPESTIRKSDVQNSHRLNSSPWPSQGLIMDRQYLRKRREGHSLETKTSDTPPTASLLDSSIIHQEHDMNQFNTEKNLETSRTSLFHKEEEWGRNGEYWITVFGYPTQAMTAVLKEFQTLGEVTQFNHGRGNWLNIQYRTRLQAELALTKNGEPLFGTTMIGTKRCYEADLSHAKSDSISMSTPITTKQRTARHTDIVDSDSLEIMRTPQRRSSICSKIFEYFFNM